MKILKLVQAHTKEEIKVQIRSIKDYNKVIDLKIIECVKNNPGISSSEIAKVFCISQKKVYSVVQEYNKKGTKFKIDNQWGGRRQSKCYLTLEEEKRILEQVSEKALNGLIITAKDIKQEFEKSIGKPVSDDYIWKVFKRNNWTKKAPRPEHPRTDYNKQEEFKKKLKKIWQPQL